MLSAILNLFILNYTVPDGLVSIVTRINVVQTLKHAYCKVVFVWSETGQKCINQV